MGNPDKKIYLHEHSHLIASLLQTDCWVNEKWQGFKSVEGEATLSLHIETIDENYLSAKLILEAGKVKHEKFAMLTDEYVLLTEKNEVALVKPTGVFYKKIPLVSD